MHDKLKSLATFADFFDLKPDLERESQVKGKGTMMGLVIDAAEESTEEIPYVAEVMRTILDHAEGGGREEGLARLEGALHRRHRPVLRCTALEVLAEYPPMRIPRTLVDIARDTDDDRTVRLAALRTLPQAVPSRPDLEMLLQVLKDTDASVVVTAVDALETLHERTPRQETIAALENLLDHENPAVVARTIEALGTFGHADQLERIFMTAAGRPELAHASRTMLTRLLERPCSILQLRPDNFERLIRSLLLRLGYENVAVTRAIRDEGVDVTAYRMGSGITEGRRHKVVVQCKRYGKSMVDAAVLERLIEDVQRHQAKEGVLITTSGFTGPALETARSHRHVELIDGPALQEHLDRAFGKGRYRIF